MGGGSGELTVLFARVDILWKVEGKREMTETGEREIEWEERQARVLSRRGFGKWCINRRSLSPISELPHTKIRNSKINCLLDR
jgi:hypothetical protein